jgi:hypothetical protein
MSLIERRHIAKPLVVSRNEGRYGMLGKFVPKKNGKTCEAVRAGINK